LSGPTRGSCRCATPRVLAVCASWPEHWNGGWRIWVGDHRMLYQIDDEAQTVAIVRVKHRREAYR
jgi:hypothetical protein